MTPRARFIPDVAFSFPLLPDQLCSETYGFVTPFPEFALLRGELASASS